jgi:putative two-component system response regulator
VKILLAEDNHFYRHAVASTLKEWGYEVIAVGDGVAALDVLVSQPNPPRLAVLDWVMPKMDGLELCTRIRALRLPESPYLIVLTAKTAKADIISALNAGADDYVTKPFDREELQARIRVGFRVTQLQASHMAVFTFARAVEARSNYTLGHSQRVTNYSLMLGERLGLGPSEMEILRNGCLLHDIGKIAVPDAILDKPGPLTKEEFEVIKQHPVRGEEMVRPLQSLSEVFPLIRSHHERLDGSGYPDGLVGDQIPHLVRIVAIADFYDAISSARPYRGPIPYAKCMEMLQKEAVQGKLDAALVEQFIGLPAASIQPTSRETMHGGTAFQMSTC